ncbi:hypothetical protein LTR85_010560 [Meristemomyces frigidus]|nr:hypothetical protein LTR85_010560 [Meristemomyces frigidus]
MAKAKDKAVPQKSSKVRKATKPAAPKPSHLSTEFVADSDDEDAPAEERSVKKVTTPAIINPTKTKGNTNAKAKADKPPPAPKPAPETESSDDEDIAPPTEDVALSPVTESAKVNGVKRKAAEQSSSEDESEEESEEEELDVPAAKKVRTDAPVEEEESGDEGSEELEEEGDAPQAASVPSPSKAPTAPARPDTTQPIPAQPFQAPAGFTTVDMQQAGAGTYSADTFAGKQIWHITAPSDVPLSSITDVALDAIQSGKTLLTHKGLEYTLNEEVAGSEQEAVLVPRHDGYVTAQQRVEKTLHLQQKITLPNLSVRQASQMTGSAAAGDVAQASVRTIRPQPKGLRMRYKPSGFGPGKPAIIGSESESADEDDRPSGSASFQFPRALGAHGGSEHQTREGGGKVPDANGPTKKPKKKRKHKQRDSIADSSMVDEGTGEVHAGAEASHETGATTSAAVTPAMKVVMPEVVEKPDVLMSNGVESEKVSKEEKARRKEEKRRKKEAKLKAKEPAG